MDHLACMTTFVTVVEKGGFAAAARHLGLAPATVTQQIQTLEQRVGARLLQRTTRKSAVTEAGRAFFDRGVKILEDIKQADAIANAYHATAKGTVRVNTSPTLSKCVGTMVARYAIQHPETSFDLTTTNRMVGVIDDRVDLAIRDDAVPDSSLIVRCVAYAEWTPCASPGYVARHGMPSLPEDLVDHNCLVYTINDGRGEWQLVDRSCAKSIQVSGTLRSSDPHVLRTAALSDHGLVLLPDAMVAEDLDAGRLVRVLSGCDVKQVSIRAVFMPRCQLPLKVRAFLDFATVEFAASLKRGPVGGRSSESCSGNLGPVAPAARRGTETRFAYPRLATTRQTGARGPILDSASIVHSWTPQLG